MRDVVWVYGVKVMRMVCWVYGAKVMRDGVLGVWS